MIASPSYFKVFLCLNESITCTLSYLKLLSNQDDLPELKAFFILRPLKFLTNYLGVLLYSRFSRLIDNPEIAGLWTGKSPKPTFICQIKKNIENIICFKLSNHNVSIQQIMPFRCKQ